MSSASTTIRPVRTSAIRPQRGLIRRLGATGAPYVPPVPLGRARPDEPGREPPGRVPPPTLARPVVRRGCSAGGALSSAGVSPSSGLRGRPYTPPPDEFAIAPMYGSEREDRVSVSSTTRVVGPALR